MINDYYGQKKSTTYLEVFSQREQGGERVVHRQLKDQEAYDTWHLALYMKEILSYKKLLQGGQAIRTADIPRKEKNLLVHLLATIRPKTKTIVELGSSLFEMLDGLELVARSLKESGSRIKPLDLKSLTFLGVEISEDLRRVSQLLHPDYKIQLFKDVTEVKSRYDLLYDRNVTSYAFTTAQELAQFINHFDVALMNLFVSKGETFIASRLGKSLTYFSLKELCSHLDKPLYHLFGEKAPGPASGQDLSQGRDVLEGFFLYGDPNVPEDLLAAAKQDPGVWEYFQEKRIAPKKQG